MAPPASQDRATAWTYGAAHHNVTPPPAPARANIPERTKDNAARNSRQPQVAKPPPPPSRQEVNSIPNLAGAYATRGIETQADPPTPKSVFTIL